jgi:hypothetical protein
MKLFLKIVQKETTEIEFQFAILVSFKGFIRF